MPLSAMRKQTSPAVPSVRMVEVDAGQEGQRLDNFLLRLCKGVPKSHIYKAIRGGEVRVNKGRISADYRLVVGDVVRVPPLRLPDPGQPKPVPASEFPVVYEDDAMLVINKPAGVAVHGGSGVSFGVIEQLRAARPEARFLELVHRLDRETSGLLMIAKKRSALLALHAMLREGRGSKRYLALVEGDWVNDRQHIRLALSKWTTQSGERRVKVDPDGQTAHTIISLKQRFGDYSLVEAELRTGRTHQIRVHLAASGFPIVGDDKYGTDETRALFARQGFNRMFLHAYQLTLDHPLTGEPLSLTAELPAICSKLLHQLEKA
ncbi:RluA family pseudouridine synthase [Bordetella avium]|uniref:RluA family pseudouridine synthase n=1 Tax=Bordetella avium TaxID=521 RepID=UPI000E0C5926|nr:RluA family pseudouridine synthase [Bordetella avium]AZY48605.1 RNA pseudouridine synthase [Bordetella avium]RIQ13912.1 RluA family pseudouridine synthase [Bordetella avium]RIQ17013.1 RluA family pseudouridine synthase [Bordetella avium]RIQ36260.1 RluA family pseudouridine synthase [Bordetella avium]RIQ39609.1 RluA family pseudouridine synthase [Bordetella avium]